MAVAQVLVVLVVAVAQLYVVEVDQNEVTLVVGALAATQLLVVPAEEALLLTRLAAEEEAD